jgi:hypothetical protein
MTRPSCPAPMYAEAGIGEIATALHARGSLAKSNT